VMKNVWAVSNGFLTKPLKTIASTTTRAITSLKRGVNENHSFFGRPSSGNT